MLDRQQPAGGKARPQRRRPEEGDLHRLRIALKKLRYTAEFFAPLYPKKKVKALCEKLRGLQEHLGDINDIAHVRASMTAMLRETTARRDRARRFAAGAGGLVRRPAARSAANRP